MPIEIRELIIKATVSGEGNSAGSGGGSDDDKQAMIQECVDQVMEILKEKEER